jgi:hypothetical protein
VTTAAGLLTSGTVPVSVSDTAFARAVERLGASGSDFIAGSAGPPPAESSDSTVAGLAAAFFTVFFAGAAVAATGGGMASRSLRMTGGSTVDDAERTNSPRSANLARMTLLSTPNSLASS